jgi:hypothetical protein
VREMAVTLTDYGLALESAGLAYWTHRQPPRPLPTGRAHHDRNNCCRVRRLGRRDRWRLLAQRGENQ